MGDALDEIDEGIRKPGEDFNEEYSAVRKPLSAWIIFSSEYRKKLASDPSSARSFKDSARIIADAYKELNQEEKQHYELLALVDKDRYRKELEMRGETASSAKTKPVESATQLIIPLARVRRTIKLDPEVKNISREALSAITKLTEYLVEDLAERSLKYSHDRGVKTIKGTDVSLAIHQNKRFDFLRSDFPFDEVLAKAATAAAAAAGKAKKQQANPNNSKGNQPSGTTASIASFFTNKRSHAVMDQRSVDDVGEDVVAGADDDDIGRGNESDGYGDGGQIEDASSNADANNDEDLIDASDRELVGDAAATEPELAVEELDVDRMMEEDAEEG